MTGWSERYGKKKAYFSDSSCAVRSEWITVNDKKYYADENGWIQMEGWFYKTDIGIMPTGRAERF